MTPSEWMEEIEDSRKREKEFRKEGREIQDIYANEKKTPFNILYSNTETLLPALFSEVPRPVVQRRYKDKDPQGRAVSQAAQRMLEYLVDTDVDDYDKFDASITSATLDGLLPGRGVTSVKYDSTDDPADDWETACTDSKKWDRVYFGYANKWSKVPWIAYEEYLDKEEATRLFGSKANKLKYTEGEETDEDEFKEENENKGYRKTAQVYQIWDKSDRQIKYIANQYKDDFLSVEDDPLNLTGFFNCPKPIQFVEKSNDLLPTALYKLYENQARELNRIQSRLNRVIEAIKVRGCYSGALGEEIEQILKEEDNALVPTDKSSMLAEGGLDQNIWFLPFAELVAVAQQLMQARESCKQVIYEVTGISDIIRGQSKASETLGAQKIKESWGTMRLKRLQKEVQRYALDTMRLILDVAVNKFSESSWVKMTGLPYSTTEQREQAQQIVEIARMNQMNPQDPTIQQAMQVLQMPNWGDVLKILKDNYSRSYRIDIETNSTLDVEATEDKALVGDFMNAMAQFMNGVAPMVQEGVMPFNAAKSMMLAIVKRYRFGREVEDELNQMQEPKPQQDPEQEKAVKEFQQAQKKFSQEKVQAEKQFEQQKKQADDQLMQEGNRLKVEKMQLGFDKKLAALELKYKEGLAKAQQDVDQSNAQNALKSVVTKHKSDVQSLLDKTSSSLKGEMEKTSKEEGPKVVKILRTDGKITGATVKGSEGSKVINILREDGEITGAMVG